MARRLTALQEKIVYCRLDHPEWPLSEVVRHLKCSPTAVYKSVDNPRCKAKIDAVNALVDDYRVMGIRERKIKLTEIARATLPDFLDADGEVKALTAATPHVAAVSEYTTV